MTRKLLSILLCVGMVWNISNAQIFNPVKWSFDVKHVEGNQYDLIFNAKIDEGWNIYSQYLESDDGPIRTSFVYEEPANLKKVGKNKESSPKRKEGHDEMFDMNVIKFGKSAKFIQRVEVAGQNAAIVGYLEYMACDAEKCLPPQDVEFEFELPEPKAASTPKPAPKSEPTKDQPEMIPTPAELTTPKPAPTPKTKPVPTPEPEKTKPSKTVEVPTKPQPIAEVEKEDVKETEKAETSTAEGASITDNAENTSESGILDPVKWTVSNKKIAEGIYEISFNAKIDKGWNIYSQFIGEDGPIPTSFVYDEKESDNYELQGKNEEVSEYRSEGIDPVFDMKLIKFKKEVSFVQKIKVKDATKPLGGYLEYMACDAEKCLPPAELEFLLDLTQDNTNVSLASGIPAEANIVSGIWATAGKGTPAEETFNKERFENDCTGLEVVKEKRTHWQTFIKGIIGGFIALLTPCVFPMIPLTVSYFLKGGKDKKKGFRDAFIYALSIIVLYTGLGTIVTAAFGADALNAMASDPWFNLALAVLLVVFALSFFGYFNIELPAKWADKTDAVADKGGLIGILGMAATLAIVSFSCTGPLIGVLLVDAVSQTGGASAGIPLGPVVGMLGFSLALALPFGLFAAFPSWLSSLPKSGGWMDDVKVSVGFIEVALALKFLAVFSLIMENKLGFKVLPYEAFVGLWVIIALLWALYFFKIFKFKKDPYASDEKQKLPMTKVIMGVLLLALAGWNLMGFQTSDAGTFHPTALMSGLAPPSCHSYVKPCECPHAISCQHDYFVAKEIAKKENKPLFIDFTGYSCENCRKNEESIWPEPGIIEKLRDDFVVVSLYVDEREKLAEPYISEVNGKRRTVGKKWADFQIIHMGSNSQPLYVLATVNDDNTATILNKPLGGLIKEAKTLENFLECGLSAHEELTAK